MQRIAFPATEVGKKRAEVLQHKGQPSQMSWRHPLQLLLPLCSAFPSLLGAACAVHKPWQPGQGEVGAFCRPAVGQSTASWGGFLAVNEEAVPWPVNLGQAFAPLARRLLCRVLLQHSLPAAGQVQHCPALPSPRITRENASSDYFQCSPCTTQEELPPYFSPQLIPKLHPNCKAQFIFISSGSLSITRNKMDMQSGALIFKGSKVFYF